MKIFIGCSSKEEIPETFLNLAEELGEFLKKEQIIIGGTKVGMMGRVVRNIPLENVTQIILKDYLEEGVLPTKSMRICDTSFERMEQIWKSADVFLFLPGGTGTLGEMISFLEENRMSWKKKKIYILNHQNYYDDIIKFIEKAKKLRFSNDEILSEFLFVNNIDELKKRWERIK